MDHHTEVSTLRPFQLAFSQTLRPTFARGHSTKVFMDASILYNIAWKP